MKRTRRALSLVMALVMLFTCAASFTANAQTLSQEEWNTYWSTSTEEIDAAVMITPGSDETERYVSWYSDSDSGSVILVNILGAEIEYKATAKKTPQGDYRLCAVISDLHPKSSYTYYCKSGNWRSETYTIDATDSDSFTAMYVTDIHISNDKLEENSVRDTAYNFNTTIEAAVEKAGSLELIISAGDQASLGARDEYTGLASPKYIKSIPFVTSVGNHDLKNVDYRFFTFQPNTGDLGVKSYVGTDYYFVKDNVLFLMLDSNNASMTDHYNFVEQAVNAHPDVKWRVAVFHHDLYSARIPSRESENQFLRLIWAPIADKFGIDLCLLGHSHYYTISNVMYNNKTVSAVTNGATITNPEGTVYMVSGSLNNPRNDDNVGLSENIGHAVLTEEKIYNLINFSNDSITINSYTIESDSNIGSITIEKTTNEGGHSYSSPAEWYYGLVKGISTIVQVFNNIGKYFDYYTDSGLSIMEILFGC